VATTIDTTATSYINLTVQLGSAADAAGTDALTVEWLEP
jgi:hypothetical protein